MRGCLLVARGKPGEQPVTSRFPFLAGDIADRAGRHAITAACFFVRGGELRGVVRDGSFSLVSDPANPWNL